MNDQLDVPDRSSQTVAMNYRYAGAWNEVSARIQLRQNALMMYVTLSCAILTIVSTKTVGDKSIPVAIDPSLLSLLMPAISMFLGFLYANHDRTIDLLRGFLSDCETAGAGSTLLGYNSIPKYRSKADAIRKMHDYSAIILILFFNGLCFFVARSSREELFDFTKWPVPIYLAFTLLSIGLVVRAISLRKSS
jgi:hypothetical protein